MFIQVCIYIYIHRHVWGACWAQWVHIGPTRAPYQDFTNNTYKYTHMFIYIHTCIYMYICMCAYVHTAEKQTDRQTHVPMVVLVTLDTHGGGLGRKPFLSRFVLLQGLVALAGPKNITRSPERQQKQQQQQQ